ncbi:jg23558 [Pararge aegeria aegeria]|uniref:Jg23558 protein n=1 Tax=Pararge aegeria aegeria TaxID=348720 RepID=A0A8S4S196_9NEOP|nr:jg23558 [Pararge aegeria aegeria]
MTDIRTVQKVALSLHSESLPSNIGEEVTTVVYTLNLRVDSPLPRYCTRWRRLGQILGPKRPAPDLPLSALSPQQAAPSWRHRHLQTTGLCPASLPYKDPGPSSLQYKSPKTKNLDLSNEEPLIFQE